MSMEESDESLREGMEHIPDTTIRDPISDAPTQRVGSGGSGSSPGMMGLAPGTRLGNYVVEEELGKGGFGVVYKARDEKLGRDVAIKLLSNPGEQRHVALFEREGRAIARLSKHANIVQIYEWGSYEGLPYFVMEYVPFNLRSLCDEHPNGMPVGVALEFARQCAEALAFAHQAGVLHRDIKPANVLLESEKGPAKIADFGLTRLMDSPETTLSGGLAGSPAYMSPEQATGAPLDARTDIYSLGVSLYQTLSGARPYEGSTAAELIRKISDRKPIPLRERCASLPEAVIDIVEKAMAPSPEDRYQEAGEMEADLRAVVKALEEKGELPTITRRGHGRLRLTKAKIAAALTGIAVLMVAVAAFWQTWRTPGTAPAGPLAKANQLLDEGRPDAAAQVYGGIDAGGDEVFYGLGYALLKLGRLDEAADAFRRVEDDTMKREGLAAVEIERGAAETDQLLEQYVSDERTPYLATLLAWAACMDGQTSQALDLLGSVDPGALRFDWQADQYRETLASCHFQTHDYTQAKDLYGNLAESHSAGTARKAEAFLRLIEERLAAEAKRDEVQARAEVLKKRIEDGYAPPKPDDAWTSRPATFFTLPVKLTDGFPNGAEVAEVLPMVLDDELDAMPGMKRLEREDLDAILAEEELSAMLSSEQGQLRLGKVLGARLIVRCELASALGTSFARPRIADTETTDSVRAERVVVPPRADIFELADSIAREVHTAVDQAYPLQGIVTEEEGRLRLNIGRGLGVEPGMRLALATEPDTFYRIPDAYAVVTDELGDDWAVVRLEGIDNLPAGKVYAFEPDEATEGVGQAAAAETGEQGGNV